MPSNSTGQLAIWKDADNVAAFTFSQQDTGVRVRVVRTPTVVNLPSPFPNDGDNYEVQDADGSCSIANNIEIVPPAGTTIRGGAMLVLSEAFVTCRLVFDSEFDDWTAEIAASSGVAPGISGEIRFVIGTAAAQLSANRPAAGAFGSVAQIEITTPYSPGTSIEIGQAGTPALLQGIGDNVPTASPPVTFSEEQDSPLVNLPILVTIAGGPVAGAGVVVVRWAVPSP